MIKFKFIELTPVHKLYIGKVTGAVILTEGGATITLPLSQKLANLSYDFTSWYTGAIIDGDLTDINRAELTPSKHVFISNTILDDELTAMMKAANVTYTTDAESVEGVVFDYAILTPVNHVHIEEMMNRNIPIIGISSINRVIPQSIIDNTITKVDKERNDAVDEMLDCLDDNQLADSRYYVDISDSLTSAFETLYDAGYRLVSVD